MTAWKLEADGLPDVDEVVLVQTDSGYVSAKWDGKRWWSVYCCDGPACYGDLMGILRWAPIPE